MSLRRLLPLLLALLVVGCGAMPVGDDKFGTSGAPVPPAKLTGPQAIFPSVTVYVEVARTESEHAKGLGGHTPLGERDGMLFIFEQPAAYAFWMKGMTFPLDLLWIDQGKIVYLAPDVPALPPSTPDSALPVYTPTSPARYVLEVNAGFARKHGIDVGTPVELKGV
jgi:uncharacterized membrane protein (UPF0127 family)